MFLNLLVFFCLFVLISLFVLILFLKTSRSILYLSIKSLLFKISSLISSMFIYINSLNIFKDLSASISGGITFKYTPALNKLFDLASSGISKLVASDNTKFVEIINGNGIKGFARAVANKMQVNGNAQLKISDAKRFNQMTTHIQYRSGYRDDAVKLNQSLLNKPYLVRNDNLPSDVAIRLVLGRDLLQQSNKSAMTNLHPEEEASELLRGC